MIEDSCFRRSPKTKIAFDDNLPQTTTILEVMTNPGIIV